MEYREISKLKSTYADALPRLIDSRTGRLHTRRSQTGAATGRLSSSSPNSRTFRFEQSWDGKFAPLLSLHRAIFCFPPITPKSNSGCWPIFSRDPVLLDAFRHGEDIHARTASEVFGIPPLMQTPEHRRAAKIINFGIVYGLSPFGLSQQLGISHKEAAHLTPLVQSDFVVTAFGEELGMTGLMAILLLYGLIVQRGLATSVSVKDPFSKILAGGLAFMLALQIFVIVGGVTRLIPLTGITTPFLSQGGSSLVASWILIALLMRLSDTARRPPPQPIQDEGMTQVVNLS